MSREWKPGDVAIATVLGVPNVRVMRRKIDGTLNDWAFESTEGVRFACTSNESEVSDIRPLVVIDPENREQVERLCQLDAKQFGVMKRVQPEEVSNLQAALREFADPKPPKPEEPTGLGAVVEDAKGDLWVRIESGVDCLEPGLKLWVCEADGEAIPTKWAKVDAIRVLSEGVTP